MELYDNDFFHSIEWYDENFLQTNLHKTQFLIKQNKEIKWGKN